MKRVALLAAVAAGLVALACGGAAPTAVDQPAPVAVTQDGGTVAASAGGKILISGFLDFAGAGAPRREFTSPGGIAHFFEIPVYTTFTGDVAGDITFIESGNAVKDPNYKTAYRGPFEGQVSWNQRSGTVSGMWHTLCQIADTPEGYTCGGTFDAQGSGGLEGVKFHFVWGPGAYPFHYAGFAFDNSK